MHGRIDGRLRAFVEAQHVFFAARPEVRRAVNVSPKGIVGTCAVVDEHTVAYLDVTASGAETIAHLREPGNGRITLMFCALEGSPTSYACTGRAAWSRVYDEEYAGWATGSPRPRGARA